MRFGSVPNENVSEACGTAAPASDDGLKKGKGKPLRHPATDGVGRVGTRAELPPLSAAETQLGRSYEAGKSVLGYAYCGASR